jgi:flagellar basal-body rod modification protein FlgD
LALSSSVNGGTAQGGYDIASDAEKVVVTIKDAQGAVIRQMDMGPQTAGTGTFTWDGKTTGANAAAGNYKFEVTEYHNGTPTPATSLTGGKVIGVTQTPQGAVLFVEGAGKIAYADIKMVL